MIILWYLTLICEILHSGFIHYTNDFAANYVGHLRSSDIFIEVGTTGEAGWPSSTPRFKRFENFI